MPSLGRIPWRESKFRRCCCLLISGLVRERLRRQGFLIGRGDRQLRLRRRCADSENGRAVRRNTHSDCNVLEAWECSDEDEAGQIDLGLLSCPLFPKLKSSKKYAKKRFA